METNLLDRMLNAYQTGRTTLIVTLQNKIRISGKIKAFDSYVIVMEGPKSEILYRHAISSITPLVLEERKRPAAVSRQAPARTQKITAQKPHPHSRQPALSAAAADQGLNTSMKDGLLKWMQEQKAAK